MVSYCVDIFSGCGSGLVREIFGKGDFWDEGLWL